MLTTRVKFSQDPMCTKQQHPDSLFLQVGFAFRLSATEADAALALFIRLQPHFQ